jgi:collagen type III alpha
MSVQTPPSDTRSPGSQFDQYVELQLESTRQQVKLTELSAGLLTLGLWTLGFLLLGILVDSWLIQFGTAARIGAFLLLGAGALWIAWSQVLVLFLRRIHRLYAARMIEEGSDNFHNSLVNYLQVKEDGPAGKEAVVHAISQRAARDLSQISAAEKVDRSRAIKLGFGFVGLVAALVTYTLLSPKSPWPSIARILNPVSSISAPSIAEVTKVTPGNTDVFFGQKLLVTAEIRGRHDPDEVKLVYSTADGQHVEVPVAMLRSGTTNSYQLELSTTPTGIDGPLTYYVTANDGRSDTYSVNVKPNPAITVEKIEVLSPSYTRLPPRTLTGQVEIEGIEGSQVKLTATANMPIQVAWVELLRQKTRGRETTYDVVKTIELRNLAAASSDSSGSTSKLRHAAAGEFTLNLDANRTSQVYSHYQVLFRTVEGQRNQLVNVQPLRVTPDLPPEIKIVRPFDREVSVPLNRSLEIELQAEDPDFEISRLELLLDHQGGRLLDEQIQLGENRKQQRLTGNYRFDPRKLKLSVGDVVIFHARASDNRVAPLSGQAEPNVARTENYSIKITESLETEVAEKDPESGDKQSESGQQANQSAQAENQSEKSETAGNQENQQAANQPEKNTENKSGENSAGQTESAMNEANPGQSNEDQAKSEEGAQQTPESGKQSAEQNQPQPNSEPSPADQQKPDQQQADKQEKSEAAGEEQKSESSGDAQSGEQSKQSSGSAGQKAQQSSGDQSSKTDQPQDGNKGEQSGEAQARPDAAEKQTGKQGADSKSAAQNSSKSGNQNQGSGKQNPENEQANPDNSQQQTAGSNSQDQNAGSGKQSSGKQSGAQSAGGQKSDGGQQGEANQPQAGEPQSGEQSNSSSNDQQQGDSKGDKGAQSGQSSSGKSKPNQSGENNSGQSEAGDSQGEESSNPSEPLDRSASDAERFQRLQERMSRQKQSDKDARSQSGSGEPTQEQTPPAGGEKSASSEQSGEKDSQQGEKANPSGGEQAPGQQPQENNPSAAGQSAKKDGEQSKSGSGRDNSGKQTDSERQSGEQTSRQDPNQTKGEKGSGESNSDQKASEQESKQGSGEPAAGEQDSEKSGAGESGDKQSGAGSQSQKQGEEAKGSGESGEQSGKAGESGKSGQSSEQSGKESGADSKQGGDDPQGGSGKSGQGSDSKQGSGPSGKSGSSGQSAAGESSGASGSSGNAAGSDNASGNNQEISRRSDQPKAQRSPGGEANASKTGVGSNEAPAANYEDSPSDPEGNLEYSRKATDLVLEDLRNQANNPDPELLKEMNWTEQDLKDFIARWDAMKQKAGNGTAQERKRYEDAVRSLGLRPESVRRNVIQSRRDQLNKLSEDGAVNRPPANLANEFNAFLKNRNRVQRDK